MTNINAGSTIFDTEHLKADLKGRSVRGGAVTVGAQGIKFILGMGSTMILARLLTPEDYGLIAMVSAVTGFVLMFKDMGLSMATVQKAEINHGQISTLFWINVGLSVIIALIIIALAPAIAWFYDEPRLTSVTMVIGLGTILSGGTAQHQALLQRNMRFTTMARIGIVSQIVGIATGIYFAWSGFEYWSLVFMGLASSLYTVIATWTSSGWLPGRPVRGSGVRPMLAFGGNLTGFNLVNYFARNLDNALIGWYWGPHNLGFYSKAYSILMLPIRQLNAPIASVGVPALSSLQNESNRFSQYYLNMVSLIAMFSLPGITFLFFMAENVVLLILGDKWMESASVFQYLALASLLQPIYASTGLVHLALGRSDRLLKYGIVACPIIVTSFFIGLPYGIKGVAICYAIANIFNAVGSFIYLSYTTPLNCTQILNAVLPSVLVSLAIGILLTLLQMAPLPAFEGLWLLIPSFILSTLIWAYYNLYLYKNGPLLDALRTLLSLGAHP